MRCEECLLLIEEYFDGEVGEPTAGLMAAHMAACAACAGAYKGLNREQNFYRRYECDAEPTPAFWTNVMAKARQGDVPQSPRYLPALRERLANAFRTPGPLRFSPSLTALIVLVAIGLTAAVMRYTGLRSGTRDQMTASQSSSASPVPSPELKTATVLPGPVENGAKGKPVGQQVASGSERKSSILTARSRENARHLSRRPVASDDEMTADELAREAEQKYLTAIAILSRDVNRRRSLLDPETIAQFEQTLAAVDRTIAGTRRAVREHPDDPVALQYMLTAYAKKVEVLRTMASY